MPWFWKSLSEQGPVREDFQKNRINCGCSSRDIKENQIDDIYIYIISVLTVSTILNCKCMSIMRLPGAFWNPHIWRQKPWFPDVSELWNPPEAHLGSSRDYPIWAQPTCIFSHVLHNADGSFCLRYAKCHGQLKCHGHIFGRATTV